MGHPVFNEIKMLNKSKFKNMVKQKIVNRALEKLDEKKESHSKVNQIQYLTNLSKAKQKTSNK